MAAPTRDEVLPSLHGQAVRIPDLQSLYTGWPSVVNPKQDAVNSVVHSVLETHSMTKAVEMKLKKANLSLLIASWYPFSSAETLKEITYFVCWMYMVDDAIIDKVSWPGLDNAAAFEEAYNTLMDFVYKSLKLDGDVEKPQPQSTIAAIDSFRHLGEKLCDKYTLVQREKFYDACKMTMNGYRTEQQLRVSGPIPTWDEYWSYREGSSCISMCVAMIELAIDSHIPTEILQSQEIVSLWRETTINTWMVNDLVSAKKELGEGFIENAVALLAIETWKAQDGMDRAVQLVKESTARFEEQARAVERKFCGLPKRSMNEDDLSVKNETEIAGQQIVSDQVRKFVENCRAIITGSLSWRYVAAPSISQNELG
jgi:hypothetical protein